MGVEVVFKCGGCDERADGTQALRKEFLSFSGRAHGFGNVHWAVRVDDVVPEGWVAFDPYTYQTYCPACWAQIMEPKRIKCDGCGLPIPDPGEPPDPAALLCDACEAKAEA
jgi:hypothetical protein